MKFKIGDYVRWISCIHNISLKKKGKIAHIIDPFTRLTEVLQDSEFRINTNKNVNIIYNKLEEFRPYESYLIFTSKKDGRILNLYWPDVDSLRKIRRRKCKKKIIKEGK